MRLLGIFTLVFAGVAFLLQLLLQTGTFEYSLVRIISLLDTMCLVGAAVLMGIGLLVAGGQRSAPPQEQ